jgi:hypothetical protein
MEEEDHSFQKKKRKSALFLRSDLFSVNLDLNFIGVLLAGRPPGYQNIVGVGKRTLRLAACMGWLAACMAWLAACMA